MFATEYYCLVAGLKEYSLDADTKGFDAKAIVGEILDGVSASDAAQVRLLYGYYDCENIASLRAGRSAHNPLGNFTREELEEEVKAPKRLPSAVGRVLRAYADPEGEDAEEVDTAQRFETALFDAYYATCSRAKSRFLREWSEFDRTLRNVTAAVTARAAGRPVEEVTVGGGDVVEQLERCSAADFGLRGELPYIDAVIAAVNDAVELRSFQEIIPSMTARTSSSRPTWSLSVAYTDLSCEPSSISQRPSTARRSAASSPR